MHIAIIIIYAYIGTCYVSRMSVYTIGGYYNRLFQKRNKQGGRGGGGAESILFWKNLWGISRFLTIPQEIPGKIKLHSWKSCQTVLHSLEIRKPKIKTTGNPTRFFLNDPWQLYFLIKPSKFCMLFLQYSWISCHPTVWFSSRITKLVNKHWQ